MTRAQAQSLVAVAIVVVAATLLTACNTLSAAERSRFVAQNKERRGLRWWSRAG